MSPDPVDDAPLEIAPDADFLLGRVIQCEARLVASLRQLVRSTDEAQATHQFAGLLWGQARFWCYGHYNQLLIASQCPRATWVQGPRQWQARGRTILPGAKPIYLLAPSRPTRGWPFKAIEVFDVSQTEGRPLPDLTIQYTGAAQCLPAIEAAISRLGIALEEHGSLGRGPSSTVLGRALGGTIQIRRDLSPEERARVLVHELAHELLHFSRSDQELARLNEWAVHSQRETEADATAWLVLRELGIDYNCPTYIAWRGGTGESILRSFKRILAAARIIRDAIVSAVGKKKAPARPRWTIPQFRWTPEPPKPARGALSALRAKASARRQRLLA